MKLIARLQENLRARLGGPSRAIAMFFLTSMASRVIGIGCQLLQVALVVKALGPESFGLWMTLNGVVGFVIFADLGLGVGAQNRLAEIFAHDSPKAREEAKAVFGSAFMFLLFCGVVLGFVCWAAAVNVDMASLFSLQDPDVIAAAPGAAVAVGLIFCAGFPIGLAQRLAFARQEGWTYNVTQAGGSVLSLILVALAARSGAGLGMIALLGQGALLLANVVLLIAQLHRLRWLAVWRLPLRLPLVRDLLKVGAPFSIQQVLNTVLFSLPPLVISTTLGAAAVTPFNLLQRIFNVFAIIQNAFMLPLWPAYSKARARGEFVWMRHTLRKSVLATAGLCVFPMAVGACFAPWIIERWIGHKVEGITWTLTILLFTWNALVFLQQPFSFLLAGASEMRRTTIYSIISAVLGTALMYALVQHHGAPGVVLGLILGSLPFNFMGNMLEARRYLRGAIASAEAATSGTGRLPVPAPTS